MSTLEQGKTPQHSLNQDPVDTLFLEGRFQDALSAIRRHPESYADNPWVDRVCSKPKLVQKTFVGTSTMDEFININFNPYHNKENPQIDILELDATEELTNPGNVVIMAFYPSTRIMSVTAAKEIHGHKIIAEIDDALYYMDPDENKAADDSSTYPTTTLFFAVDLNDYPKQEATLTVVND